jgi:hypothetical protein
MPHHIDERKRPLERFLSSPPLLHPCGGVWRRIAARIFFKFCRRHLYISILYEHSELTLLIRTADAYSRFLCSAMEPGLRFQAFCMSAPSPTNCCRVSSSCIPDYNHRLFSHLVADIDECTSRRALPGRVHRLLTPLHAMDFPRQSRSYSLSAALGIS